MSALLYPNDDMHVDLGDVVTVKPPFPELSFEGEVTKVYPRKGQVRLKVTGHHDYYRTSGLPKMKSTTVPVEQLQLEHRTQ